jgi:hypothetical protein
MKKPRTPDYATMRDALSSHVVTDAMVAAALGVWLVRAPAAAMRTAGPQSVARMREAIVAALVARDEPEMFE